MKAMNMMKSIALAAVMMIASQASAANNQNADPRGHSSAYSINLPIAHPQGVVKRIDRTAVNGRGHQTVVQVNPARPSQPHQCQCGECRKIQKKLAKHLKKSHKGKQSKVACRDCMKYSQQLNTVHAHINMQGMGHCLQHKH